MKALIVLSCLALFTTACSHKENRNTPNRAEGYTHSVSSTTQEGTGIQEEEMSSGDPQNDND